MNTLWRIVSLLAFGAACIYAGTTTFPDWRAIIAILTTLGSILAAERQKGNETKDKRNRNLDRNTPFTAKYGSKTNFVDVTGILKNRILHGCLSVRASTSELCAGRDPAYGEEKELLIEFPDPSVREIRVLENTRFEIK